MADEPTPKTPEPKVEAQKRVSEAERIQALRERLYARNSAEIQSTRHTLSATPDRADDSPVSEPHASHSEKPVATLQSVGAEYTSEEPYAMTSSTSRRKFRFRFALIGVFFFVGALIVSSFFLVTGGNAISGDNITLSIAGPLTVGGGEDLGFQIAVANQNTLPIESATLIIEYPKGTQSVSEPGKTLYTERQQLNNIESGEVVNVPVHALMFGEENEERFINAAVEYRVRGSNATFYKEAEPYRFKISTSPVIISIDTVERVPSGQEVSMDIVVQSNSPTQLNDILVKAGYPQGFDYSSASPEPASGQDTWRIERLEPGEKTTITLTGIIVGVEQVPERFVFEVGVANERDRFTLASPLMTAKTDINIEKPFLDVAVAINSVDGEVVTISNKETANVQIKFKNALENTVYDGSIFVELEGNALDEIEVNVAGGHYDSIANTITWDAVSVPALRELAPGATHEVSFMIDPSDDVQSSPEIDMKVSIQANRVLENNVSEKVTDTTARTVKVTSVASLASSAIYTDGPFVNSGPVPPVAEETTEYTVLLTVKNSTNGVADAEVTAVLPQYVTWLDRVSDGDVVTYTPSTRTVRWDIGDMNAQEYVEMWMQVALTPSLSQVGTTPTMVGIQRFKAVDRFTGTVIRADAAALTTSLKDEPDSEKRDGRVQKEE